MCVKMLISFIGTDSHANDLLITLLSNEPVIFIENLKREEYILVVRQKYYKVLKKEYLDFLIKYSRQNEGEQK